MTVRTGQIRWPRLGAIDLSILALCVTSSVVPLAMMAVRQRQISSDDILYSTVMWKLFAEYIIVRTAISTREQAMRCLVLLLAATAIVSFVGILQAVGVGHVSARLDQYTSSGGQAPTEGSNRGAPCWGCRPRRPTWPSSASASRSRRSPVVTPAVCCWAALPSSTCWVSWPRPNSRP